MSKVFAVLAFVAFVGLLSRLLRDEDPRLGKVSVVFEVVGEMFLLTCRLCLLLVRLVYRAVRATGRQIAKFIRASRACLPRQA
jgi:hypothetical protein